MSREDHNRTARKSRWLWALMTISMLVLSLGASAQTYVGVRGGYGIGSARIVPEQEMRSVVGLPSAGVSIKYFSDMKFVGAIQADLQYIENAYKYDLAKDSDSSYMRTINTIELPIMWHPHIYVMNRTGRVFFNLGVNFSYNVSSYEKYTSKENGVYQEGDYDFILVRDNRWGYGLVGGVGASIFWNKFEFMAEARYYYGYSDVLKNYVKYSDNPMRSPLDNLNISLGIYYRLGSGGIKSQPSNHQFERMQARALERESLRSTPTEEAE